MKGCSSKDPNRVYHSSRVLSCSGAKDCQYRALVESHALNRVCIDDAQEQHSQVQSAKNVLE